MHATHVAIYNGFHEFGLCYGIKARKTSAKHDTMGSDTTSFLGSILITIANLK